MSDRNIWHLIRDFHSQRNPAIVAQKYQKMRDNPFSFLRGTAHLFYRDFPFHSPLNQVPQMWICGDLHLENFGTYKGEDRKIYFGINDFDEGALAPCTWDLTRFITSLFVAAEILEIDGQTAKDLAQAFLFSYSDALRSGQIRIVDKDNAQGVILDLLTDLEERKRLDLLTERTKLEGGYRRLKIDGTKMLAIAENESQRIINTIDGWAQTQPEPSFFRVLDIATRIAGTASLGLDRYLILVEGKGSTDRNYLLDLKEQPISALQPYLISPQPQWQNAATRVMKIENLVQSAPPALMAAIEINGKSYLLRELQPTQDKIALKSLKGKLNKLDKLVDTMAKVTAYAHLHGSGKQGANNAQELMDFSNQQDWQQQAIGYAINYAGRVATDYRDFCTAIAALKAGWDLDKIAL